MESVNETEAVVWTDKRRVPTNQEYYKVVHWESSVRAMGLPEHLVTHKLNIRNGDLKERLETMGFEALLVLTLTDKSPKQVMGRLMEQRNYWIREQRCRLPCELCLEVDKNFKSVVELSSKDNLYFKNGL